MLTRIATTVLTALAVGLAVVPPIAGAARAYDDTVTTAAWWNHPSHM